MRAEILMLALIVGGFTWAFRYLPLTVDLSRLNPKGWPARLLGATGPAAIATLFVASILPEVGGADPRFLPLGAGMGAVLAVWLWQRSVVGATLAGSAAYAAAFALAGVLQV